MADNAAEDGRTVQVVVPGFHRVFRQWHTALGEMDQHLDHGHGNDQVWCTRTCTLDARV